MYSLSLASGKSWITKIIIINAWNYLQSNSCFLKRDWTLPHSQYSCPLKNFFNIIYWDVKHFVSCVSYGLHIIILKLSTHGTQTKYRMSVEEWCLWIYIYGDSSISSFAHVCHSDKHFRAGILVKSQNHHFLLPFPTNITTIKDKRQATFL